MSAHPSVGTNAFDLDTPALLVDLEAMEYNIRVMTSFFRGLAQQGRGCRLRPHIKTHKATVLAQRQMAEECTTGITCAKLSEAEVMAAAGIRDILIANQVVGRAKIERVMRLVRRADVKVAVDHADNVAALSAAASAAGVELGVLVEVNVGNNRCGVAPGEEALELARLVERAPGLSLVGLQGYEGHLVHVVSREERRVKVQEALGPLVETRRLIEASGLPVRLVSGGSTSTYCTTAAMEGIDEVQAGSYILMDSAYEKLTPEFRCALTVLGTVVSRPEPRRLILDVGMKAVTLDHGPPRVIGLDAIRDMRFYEEHLRIETDEPAPFRVGDKVQLVTAHVCTTVNLYDRFHAVTGGKVEAVWPIEARGCSQ